MCNNKSFHFQSLLNGISVQKLLTTFMFMTAWVSEARHCPNLLNEINKTKLQIYTSPQAGINISLCVVPFTAHFLVSNSAFLLSLIQYG
jgi:hypothetical protein